MSSVKSKSDNALVGAAGVHFVVSELSLRGLIALPTIRNTAGVDVVVVSADGAWHANLQAKTSKNKVTFWPVGKRYEELCGKNNFYVFVRYLKKESRFEAFLESADRVAEEVKARSKTLEVVAMQNGLLAGTCQRIKQATSESVGSGLSLDEGTSLNN